MKKTSSLATRPLSLLILWTMVCGLWTIFPSCKVYTFTGASVSPDLKTLSIQNFTNKSQNANTAITQDLTDKLKNRLVQETPLRMIPSNGDLEIKGTLVNYAVSTQAPTGGTNTLGAIGRLTMTVKVECANNKNDKESWEQTFTRFADFPSTTPVTQVERELWDVINRQIVDDIFNRAFVNW
jgi:DNA-directed RNA polymerase subunit M/transcription elongation factor TFIIS